MYKLPWKIGLNSVPVCVLWGIQVYDRLIEFFRWPVLMRSNLLESAFLLFACTVVLLLLIMIDKDVVYPLYVLIGGLCIHLIVLSGNGVLADPRSVDLAITSSITILWLVGLHVWKFRENAN